MLVHDKQINFHFYIVVSKIDANISTAAATGSMTVAVLSPANKPHCGFWHYKLHFFAPIKPLNNAFLYVKNKQIEPQLHFYKDINKM